jgi:hypothetical protein
MMHETQQTGASGQGAQSSGGQGMFPVDNATYNLLQTLTSKLEAIEAYSKYSKDGDQNSQQFFNQMMQTEQQHARQLMQMLKQRCQSW